MVVFAVAFDGSLLAGGFCWSWRDALLDDLMLFLKVVPRRARRLLRHEHMCITLRLRLAILDPTVVAMLAEPMLKTSVVDKTISMRPYPRQPLPPKFQLGSLKMKTGVSAYHTTVQQFHTAYHSHSMVRLRRLTCLLYLRCLNRGSISPGRSFRALGVGIWLIVDA